MRGHDGVEILIQIYGAQKKAYYSYVLCTYIHFPRLVVMEY